MLAAYDAGCCCRDYYADARCRATLLMLIGLPPPVSHDAAA